MQHVSSEHFIAHIHSGNGLVIKKRAKAEFRIGTDGKVDEVGIAMEEGMPDHKFWFKKTFPENLLVKSSKEGKEVVSEVNGVHKEEVNGFTRPDLGRTTMAT